MSTVVSGHLWWRRWTPSEEFVILWLETPDGNDTDAWIHASDLDEELDHWARGEFRWIGATYHLTWLDDAETAAMRRELELAEPPDRQ